MIALDTNLLVYAHRAAAPEHVASREAIERAAQEATAWGFADTVVAEFWSVVTHPVIPGRPSTPDEALAFIEALRQAGAHLWMPKAGAQDRLMQSAVQMNVRGARIFDLRIALTVFEQGCTQIWTRDEHFVSVPGLLLVRPF